MRLLLIRHGQSISNTEGRLQGQFDSPLTDLGRAQARALARKMLADGQCPSAVLSSDLSRAAETAEIVAAALDAPLTLDARLREYDIGVLTNIVWTDIESLYPELWQGLNYGRNWVPIPGEEGSEAVRTRLVSLLADVEAAYGDEDTVALVSHGGSLGVLLAHLLGIDTRRPTPFRFDNTSLSIVELGLRGPRLFLFNDTCHLDGDLR